MAPGSGALYKHFASKRALLEAAVAHRIESIVAAREEYDAESPAGVEKAVRSAGQLIRDNLAESEDVLRVMPHPTAQASRTYPTLRQPPPSRSRH